MAEISGTPSGRGRRFAIIASRFNEGITVKLLAGAHEALEKHGVPPESVDVVWVPGAWELPAAARRLLSHDRYDALIALGAVVRGATAHFEYVAGEAARGLARASAEYDRPIGFGLLTCETMQQALERAGGVHGNKGWDAALAALEMTDLFDRLDSADAG